MGLHFVKLSVFEVDLSKIDIESILVFVAWVLVFGIFVWTWKWQRKLANTCPDCGKEYENGVCLCSWWHEASEL